MTEEEPQRGDVGEAIKYCQIQLDFFKAKLARDEVVPVFTTPVCGHHLETLIQVAKDYEFQKEVWRLVGIKYAKEQQDNFQLRARIADLEQQIKDK